MKKYLALLIMFVAVFCGVMSAAGEKSDKHFDPQKDIVITCDSNPKDFEGTTVNGDIYIALTGCSNLQSSIVPGENAFLTLRDIRVNGTLFYTDDRYDSAAGIYTKAGLWDNYTKADHYLNIAGDSYIENLYVECMNQHDCNLGFQYPTTINNLEIVPTNSASRGAIRIRGYIDPLVDPDTDYYKDSAVAAFPNFDFNTFDNDFANPLLDKYNVFLYETNMIATDGIYYGSRIRSNDTFYYVFINDYPYDKEVRATEVLLHRGRVNNMYIYNKYLVGSGDTNIDLINLFVEIAMITNGKNYDSTTPVDFSRAWTPVLRGSGFTNFGIVSVFSQLKTDVLVKKPYSKNADKIENAAFPMYIDVMVVGTEGLTEKISLNSTKIAMFQYLGGLSPYSVLDLEFSTPDEVTLNHIPTIGILIAHGGKINLNAQNYFSKILYVGAFWLFSGRDDLRFQTDASGIGSAAGILSLPISNDGDNTSRSRVYIAEDYENNERSVRENLYNLYADQYGFFNDADIYEWTKTMITTAVGANWIVYVLDKYREPAPSSVKQAYTTKIVLGPVAFGDLNVDSTMEDVIGSNWFSSSCAVHQYGERASSGAKIIHVLAK
ncbi:MAG: hypothetical protein IJI14_05025 [Anaerolineaceae bacterium]|nr:hypothetical protein [Anaerolineaceae bacterium]